MATKKIDPAKLTPDTLALLLTNAGQKRVTESQVLEIAEAGGLLSVDDMRKSIRNRSSPPI